MARKKTYGLGTEAAQKRIPAPPLPYAPRDPKQYRPCIGLIGCGGITQSHLTAYKMAGYNIVALCDIDESRARARQKEFYPRAQVYTDYHRLLSRDDIEVVDVATHPDVRPKMVRDALVARKHVLSQKPYVLNLNDGHRLADLADKMGVKLAVNQNGRWAPHFSYMRQAVAKGLIGQVLTAHLAVHWNHDWVAKTPFNKVHHVILYDFAIHWFDILNCFMSGRPAKRVYASIAPAKGQTATPPLLGQALVEYDDAQASLSFDGFTQIGPRDTSVFVGTEGSMTSTGPNLGEQTLTIQTSRGHFSPKLQGSWFPDGFHGTMAELLCAIEEKRQPFNNARDNLKGLAVCFAATRSADTGRPQVPGKVQRLSDG